jgi:hypothetical protein
MANELSLLGGNLPAHLRGQLDETTKALMGNSAGGESNVKRISIKGSVFRMMVAGKEVAKNEDRAMNVIIVGAAQYNSRHYYEGTFTEGQAGKLPDCFSDDGIKPSSRSTSKQCDTCKDCPQNIAGSAQGSATARACKFSRRLAVILENDQQGDVFQLTLPAQSIFGKAENGKMPLEAYVRLLGSNNVSVTSVVTEMRFDTDSATPKLTFKAVRYLEADEFANSQAKGKTAEAKTAIGSTVGELDNKLPAPAPKAEAKPAPAPKAEKVEAEAVEEPVKRPAKKADAEAPKDLNSVLDDWT